MQQNIIKLIQATQPKDCVQDHSWIDLLSLYEDLPSAQRSLLAESNIQIETSCIDCAFENQWQRLGNQIFISYATLPENNSVDNRFNYFSTINKYTNNLSSISEQTELTEPYAISENNQIRTISDEEALKLTHKIKEEMEKKWEAYLKKDAPQLATSK